MMKTGIERLDELVGGGFAERSNFLVIGPPGSGKEALLLHFLAAGKAQSNPAVFVTTDNAPLEIEKRAISLGLDFAGFAQARLLKFVDCYSWALQAHQDIVKRDDIFVPGPSSLNELSIAISKALLEIGRPPMPSRVSFQSLSTLLLYNNPEVVFRFIQVMGARLKQTGSTTLFSIESGMHPESTIATLEHLLAGTVEFKVDGERRFFRVPRVPGGQALLKWTEYDITPYGISVKG